MKRVLPKFIFYLNISIIILLLFLSGSMVYFSSSSTHQFFGHSVILYAQKAQDPQPPQTLLLLIQQNHKLTQGDTFLYYKKDSSNQSVGFVDTASQMIGESVILKSAGMTVSMDSIDYFGKVVFQSKALGNLFLTLGGNLGMTLFGIGGGFVLLCIINISVFVMHHKKQIRLDKDNPVEVTLENEASQEAIPVKKPVVIPQPLANTKATREAPLQQKVSTYDYRKRPQNIGKAPVWDNSDIERENSLSTKIDISIRDSDDQDLFDDEFERQIKMITHEFDTVEELYQYYHHGAKEKDVAVLDEKPPSSSETEFSAELAPPTVCYHTSVDSETTPIASLLDEIMKQAQEDYFKEHKDNLLEEYMK